MNATSLVKSSLNTWLPLTTLITPSSLLSPYIAHTSIIVLSWYEVINHVPVCLLLPTFDPFWNKGPHRASQCSIMVRESGARLSGCVWSSRSHLASFCLSFLTCYKEDNHGDYLEGLVWELNKIIYAKCLEQVLAHSKCSINTPHLIHYSLLWTWNLIQWLEHVFLTFIENLLHTRLCAGCLKYNRNLTLVRKRDKPLMIMVQLIKH